ncbi:MAG: response regulator [Acaryochloris sp. SU_5_25]|nr:response regulator [Acaryochloris sp. SU_5_25]
MIRIVIADDQTAIQVALQARLRPYTDLEVVGRAGNGRQAVERVAQLQPDVILLDLEIPILDGFATTQQIKEHSPNTKILVLTQHQDLSFLLPVLQAGAHGYLLKTTSPEDLAHAIQLVHKGYFQVGPGIMEPTLSASLSPAMTPADTPIDRSSSITLLRQEHPSQNGLVPAATQTALVTPPALAVSTLTFDRPVLLKQSSVWSHAIIWGIISATSLAILAAYLFKIEEAIQATGQLEPQGVVKEIQSPVVGVVKQIQVKDGQQVKKGDVLLRLDPKSTQSELSSLRRIRQQLLAENAFYRQQIQGTVGSLQTSVPSVQIPSQMLFLAESRRALTTETQLYRSQLHGKSDTTLTPEQQLRLRSSLQEEASRTSGARLETEQLQKQLQQAQIQQVSARKTLAVNQDLLDQITPIAKAGGIPKVELLKQQEAAQKSQAELERLQKEESRLNLAIAQAQEKVDNTVSGSRKDLLAAIAVNEKQIAEIDSQFAKTLVGNQNQISEIDNKLNQAQLMLNYREIRSPVNGTVFDLKPQAPGFVANTSEPVLKIVPTEVLTAKVFLTNRDIGFIRVGMSVDVRIDSFPFSEFGDIKGTLVWVGSDALPPTQTRPFYSFPAKVRLDQQFLTHNGRKLSLQSGMALNANLKLRKRTLISIFTDLFAKEVESLKLLR